MSDILRRWLLAFLGCGAFCVLAITLLDQPVLCFFARHHLAQEAPVEFPLYLATLLVPLGAGAIPVCGLTRLRRRPVPQLARALMLAGFAVLSALVVTHALFKPLFGRSTIAAYFAAVPRYDFHLFGGTWESSFPSGHAVIITAFLSVFWILYPRWRVFYAGAAMIVLLGLAVVRWHFVSDIAAGAFVGCLAGPVTLALWRRRPNSKALAILRRPAVPGLWR
jgi:membrane-associated phospholipid phosphatase